ncbi:MAG: hypothetical protein H6559_09780 [Lewinellaceae bacterium]|nr:hypothetical protein [Lewinellaceae bacterium]
MRTMLLILFMVASAITAFGQDKIDVVYLKDGRVVKGSIIKPLDADGVQIMTTESDVYTFSADEVRRVAREAIQHDNIKNKVFVHDAEGFTNITTLGYGFGIGTVGDANNNEDYFALHTVNGFHVNRMISLGVGVGIEGYGDYELVPLYADIRIYPARTEWAPFFYGDLGYGLGVLEKNTDGGLMAAIGGGLQRSVNPNLAFVASIGYRYQENTVGTEELNASYLQLSVGVKF